MRDQKPKEAKQMKRKMEEREITRVKTKRTTTTTTVMAIIRKQKNQSPQKTIFMSELEGAKLQIATVLLRELGERKLVRE